MVNLESLYRQHQGIKEEVQFIEAELSRGLLLDQVESALHINKLAGQLNIHLMSEDQFLYPSLLNCSDKEIRAMAIQYIAEMGDFAKIYQIYKNDYNTSKKIMENLEAFIKDTRKIIDMLKKRVAKEENELYVLVRNRGI